MQVRASSYNSNKSTN